MLKGYYSNLEIAKIVHQCKSIDELKKAGHALVTLHEDYEILDIRFFELLAHKRIRIIIDA
ncbi:hypothetical protein CJ739_116 [Mariniflexile rhizosphaerae]|uniref:hypothetical protein n=1 Tax=unclassified Mariniflexile TaxID=2643887 RepID=UPI000E330C52|nr:hypothetical protein [Mariniflexile sp. TRM1-10]AXP79216.1 hypothetical protein CJ739_116 [Mariniflexile sp. TRM1-10]